MMTSLLASAIEEEQQLLQKLEAVRNVIRAYGGVPSVTISEGMLQNSARAPKGSDQQIAHSRRPNNNTQRILSVARGFLEHHPEGPVPTRIILGELRSQNIEVVGKNAVSSLSAILSHADDFISNGRSGWTLRSAGIGVTEATLKAIGAIPEYASIPGTVTASSAAKLAGLRAIIEEQRKGSGHGN